MAGRAVIMGVAGSGKSSVGLALAPKLGAIYIDGDDLHPAENVAKMAAGQPLDDADRAPWLEKVGEVLHAARGPVLVGCSALKRKYRDQIRSGAGGPVVFLHLEGTREVIAERMAARDGHFMPLSLLDSQFAALEPLAQDEAHVSVDIARPLDEVVARAADGMRNAPGWR